MLAYWLALLIFLVANFYFLSSFYRKCMNYWPSQKVELIHVQSMLSRIVTGQFSFIKQDVDMYTKLKANGQKYGGYMELWNPIFFPVDLDLIKNIMIKDFEHFSEHRGLTTPEEPHIYQNLFNITGEQWRDLRVKMTPAFTTGKMRRMEHTFNSSSKKLVEVLNSQVGPTQPSTIVIRPHLQNVVMDLIANAAFRVQTNIFDVENSEFIRMGNKVLDTFAGLKAMLKITVNTMLPKIGKLFKVRLMDREADTFFSEMVRDVIHKRTHDSVGEGPEDFIQVMMEAKKSFEQGNSKLEMTEDLLIAQCILFVLGGFETVDSLLSWAVYELALNPEIQNKLYEEIKAGCEGNGGQFSYDLLMNELNFLDQVVQETLRKYPPLTRMDRKTTKTYKVPNSDVVLAKDSFVMIPIYAIHHDPEIYPEPNKFIPERFSQQNRHSCAFAAFGLGPRNCIGNRFALAEVKFVLANLILNFELSPSSHTKIPAIFSCGFTLKPDDGLPLTVRRRK